MATYPKLPDGFEIRLQAVVLASNGTGKEYLEAPECPYTTKEKDFLRKILAQEIRIEVSTDWIDEAGDKFESMLREVEKTISEMKALENDLVGAETSDRVAVLKAKTTLLEKWTSLKERIYTLKEISEFQSVILETLDTVCNKDQRNEFMKRLQHLRSVTETTKG